MREPTAERSALRRGLPWMAVAAAVAFGMALLLPEAAVGPPESNDRVVHGALVTYAAEHWDRHWPVDFWYPSLTAGFPVFAHYPHLSHLAGAAVARGIGADDPAHVYLWINDVLLALVPALVYLSVRRLGLSAWAGAFGAWLYPLAFSNPYLGIGWESFVHDGSGLMPQVWGVAFIFPAVAWGRAAIHAPAGETVRVRGRRVIAAGFLLAACVLSHSVYGYMAALSIFLLLFVPGGARGWSGRVVRLAGIASVCGLAAAYFIVPFVSHVDQVLKSRWEPAWKYDSIGLPAALQTVGSGRLFDGGAVPVLTAVIAAASLAAVVGAIRRRDGRVLWLAACVLVWFALFAGRATWGGLVDWLPFAGGLPMHRFSGGVQVFALMLAAAGLDDVRRFARKRWNRAGLVAVTVVLALAAIAPASRRIEFMGVNRERAIAHRAALDADDDFRAVVASLRTMPPGRVHAGMYYNWGRSFDIGDIPVYTHLQSAGFDMVGYPFMGMAPPTEWQVRADFRNPGPCDLFNVRYLVAPAVLPVPPFARPVERRGRYAVYEIPTSGYCGLGRVSSWTGAGGSGAGLDADRWGAVYAAGQEWLERFDPAEPRYLTMGAAVDPPPRAPVRGTIDEETVAPGRLGCSVTTEGGADVVVKTTYHPFWRVTVDGRPVRPVRVFPGFLAVRVGPGEHRVELRYRPPVYQKVLFAVTLAAALAGGVLALRAASRRLRGAGRFPF